MIKSYLDERMLGNEPFLDELSDAKGNVKPHWERIAQMLNSYGPDRMAQTAEDVGQLLKENGVTYNVYDDPSGMNRPWNLDPVPMVFDPANWQEIVAGLKQRAKVLNYILKDIYGERKLIRSGLLPFEMIYNHRGFLRQVDKLQFEGYHQLIQYSADLARGPDGKMWVLHDRTDAPSGVGYTLENRAAMTRVFPDLIRENAVQKISGYYQKLKETISEIAYQDVDDLRIVFLSPGEGNETFFEHAYLASFLGFTLVVGEDLTFKNGYVWLKTIEGLEKVDVIVRRVDDVFCDPLEFLSSSHLGVVGLMEAVRQGKVIVVNPLGTRILENPAIMAFLPKIARQIFSEELILPSVATWWCGQEKEKNYVLNNIENLIIRQIYRNSRHRSVVGRELSPENLQQLKQQIQKHPYLYVGQEIVNFSTTPSFIDNRLEARNAIFRSYVVADTEKEDYYVMPGGLSRSSPVKGFFMVSNQTGGISKDTWVLSDPNVEEEKIKYTSKVLHRTQNILPSRTGEHLFWQGRYLERCAQITRLMRVACKKFNEADVQSEQDPALDMVLIGLTELTGTLPGFNKKKKRQNPTKELLSLAMDEERLGSLAHSIRSFLNNSYTVRDRLSIDTWRILDTISQELNQLKILTPNVWALQNHLDSLVVKLMAFNGLNIDNMTREPTWHLLNLGRFTESAVGQCIMLRSMLAKESDQDHFRSLLEYVLISNESLVTYRYRYRSTLELESVLSLLLQAEDNPRSLIYQVQQVDYHISHLPSVENNHSLNPIRKQLLEAATKLRLADLSKLSEGIGKEHTHKHLVEFLNDVTGHLYAASDMILKQYFSHTESIFSFVKSETVSEL